MQSTLDRPRGLIDLLNIPVVGRVLRWRYGRLVLQIPLLLIAVLLIYDGFTGSDRAGENLATVLPWVHYRGVIVVVLLLIGNLFCMGCPFTIPRTIGKRLSLNKRRFPRLLRNKWLASASIFILFFLYEYLDLWASPALTAWVVVAYFVLSFAMEAFFGESAFCKYVCPLGTFNFIYSTTAPTQITAKSQDICRSCVGKECVNGSFAQESMIRVDEIPIGGGETKQSQVVHSPQGTPGCGLELFVPQIKTNLDCTLCLDCVRACPHDNVALTTRTPGRELFQPDSWPKRWDITFLVIGVVFIGLLNAFGMVNPIFVLMQDMAESLGLLDANLSNEAIEFIVLGLIFIGGGIIAPLILTLAAAQLSHVFTRNPKKHSLRHVAASFAPAFVPIGLGIWIAHYGFHFLTGIWTFIPVTQFFLIDHGITILGSRPDWTLSGVQDFDLITALQIAVLVGGFLWSMIVAQAAAARLYGRQATQALLPWALLLVLIMYLAISVFSLEMEMRGTIFFG